MANVAFKCTEDATAAFLAAQEDRSVRALALGIESECIVLRKSMSAGSRIENDFDSIIEGCGLTNESGSFVLFCLDAEAVPEKARQWVLIAWVPENCRPKDKMLYSSSRDNLKRALGTGYFAADYYCNETSEVTWTAYQAVVNDKGTDGPLSEKEIMLKEEAALERDTSTKSSAMGEISFAVLPAATDALAAFVAGGAPMALSLEDEKVSVHAPSGACSGPLSSSLASPSPK